MIKFGTDGWRGVIGDDFTFKNVNIVSQAISDYINQELRTRQKPKVVVGFDTRFLGNKFAEILSEVLVRNNIDVILSDRPVPTPILSFQTWKKKFTLGVMITASHNPYQYSGIKIKTKSGGSAPQEVTKEIEKRIGKSETRNQKPETRIKKLNLTEEYVSFLRSYIDLERLKRAKFNILVDVMYGSGDSYIEKVLENKRTKIKFLHNEINPCFGGTRPEPIEENLTEIKEILKKERFDLGFALDGDADRIAAFDSEAKYIHPQKILPLLLIHLIENRNLRGGVVKTIAGTTLIDKVCREFSLKLYETPVGFKHISKLMIEEDVLIGGEEAGGIGFKGYIPERDGTLAGLLILELLAYKKIPLHKIIDEMEKRFGKYYYLREDIHTDYRLQITDYKKWKSLREILGKKIVEIKDFDGMKFICEDESWLMLRGSGTENLFRVYSEAKDLKRAKELIKFGRRLIGVPL